MWQCVDDGYCRLIYIDTDSLYYEGPKIDFSEYNAIRQKRSADHDAIGVDAKGKTHYMGVLEEDDPIDHFKTWGAKKYMYERVNRKKVTSRSRQAGPIRAWSFRAEHKVTITIAGVNKTKGREELENRAESSGKDSFDLFERGFTFRDAGGQEAWYNDGTYGSFIDPESGKSVFITSNVYLQDGEYTLGTGTEYSDMLEHFRINPLFCEQVLDNWRNTVYNRISG